MLLNQKKARNKLFSIVHTFCLSGLNEENGSKYNIPYMWQAKLETS